MSESFLPPLSSCGRGSNVLEGLSFYFRRDHVLSDRVKFTVAVHGGRMLAIRELAQVKLADPRDEAIPVDSISLLFIRECVALGTIVDPEPFRIGRPRDAFIPFTPTVRTDGSTRGRPVLTPLTRDQEQALVAGADKFRPNWEKLRRIYPCLSEMSSLEIMHRWGALCAENRAELGRDVNLINQDEEEGDSDNVVDDRVQVDETEGRAHIPSSSSNVLTVPSSSSHRSARSTSSLEIDAIPASSSFPMGASVSAAHDAAEEIADDADGVPRARSRSPRRPSTVNPFTLAASNPSGRNNGQPAICPSRGPDTSLARTAANTGRACWTDDEKKLLLAGYQLYGSSWEDIRAEYSVLRKYSGVQLKDKFRAVYGSRAPPGHRKT